jgi:hypothetical protein
MPETALVVQSNLSHNAPATIETAKTRLTDLANLYLVTEVAGQSRATLKAKRRDLSVCGAENSGLYEGERGGANPRALGPKHCRHDHAPLLKPCFQPAPARTLFRPLCLMIGTVTIDPTARSFQNLLPEEHTKCSRAWGLQNHQ